MLPARCFLLLLLSFFLVQCDNGAQNKTEFLKATDSGDEEPRQEIPEAPLRDSSDFDPFFTESTDVTSAEGPGAITRNVFQDRDGNIWLATWKGIMQYDGANFINYTNKEGLRRHRIFCIIQDKSGDIWFGSIGAGVYRYDGQTFTNYTAEHGLADDRVHCLYEDSAGRIWIGTNGGISIFDPTVVDRSDEILFNNRTTDDGLMSNDVNSIVEDMGRFWIGTRGSACTYDGKTFTPVTRSGGEHFHNVRRVIKAGDGAIWLGGNDGLWRYKDDTFTQISEPFTGYIYEDRAGNIWTSAESTSGPGVWTLNRYTAAPFPVSTLESTEILRQENMFFDIMEDTDGNIWVGKLDGTCRVSGPSVDCF